MAYKIVIKKRFEVKLIKVLNYLEVNWGDKVAEEFLLKVDTRLNALLKHPHIGAPSNKTASGARELHITPHNRLYYKIDGNKIIIANMYDTRTKGYK